MLPCVKRKLFSGMRCLKTFFFSELPSGRSCVFNLRGQFTPGPEFVPGSSVLRAGALTNFN